MFNVSLSDRLKAAVNQLEATGTSLQARAQAGLAAVPSSSSAQQSPASSPQLPSLPRDVPLPVSPRHSGDVKSPVLGGVRDESGSERGLSPTRTTAFSPGTLAEGALSGLRGLRSGFGLRASPDGQRPAGSPATSPQIGQEKELQDIPHAAGPSSPRATSPVPNRLLSSAPFQIGTSSDPSSSAVTPVRPRSPGPSHLRTASRSLPPPNPHDPASYPLPPSPTSTPSPLLATTPMYADPLGASPLIPAVESMEVPDLGIEEATPDIEKSGLGLGVEGTAHADIGHLSNGKEAEGGISSEETRDPGTESIPVPPSVQGAGDTTQLQSQILAADKVLRELTPLDGGIADPQALEDWVRMVTGKVGMMGDEMKRLQGKLNYSRMEELRDTHRLEASSQTDLVSKLRTQLSTAETNLASRTTELAAIPQLRTDLSKAQTQVKEEEEKRTKAISLLKTVRLKLVKAEKDKEEVERDRAEERAERSRATEEVERVKAEMQREVSRLRTGFEREIQGVKDRAEREMKERKGAWELEMITTKAAHAKDITAKTVMVNGLEAIVKELSAVKDEQFHTIQARQAEAETARAESETLANRTKELEFQLREANERVTLLEDTPRVPDRGRPHFLETGDRFSSSPSPSPSRQNLNGGSSASEVQRLLAEAEARAEAKLSDLRFRVRSLEKERNEQEEEFGQKLQERVYEIEKLRRAIQEKEGEVREADSRVDAEKGRTAGEVEKRLKVEKELKGMMARLEEAKEDVATAQEGEKMAKDELSQLKLQLQTCSIQLEDQKQLVQNLRSANKTLREEMRKVQSSAQLMEKSRNPGVGYWSATSNPASGSSSMATTPTAGMRSGEATPVTASSRQSVDGIGPGVGSNGGPKGNEEEEVNLEYLRNVILQFLENPLMRRQLVQVLAVILHFTPQELRRLNAKITA